MTGSTLFTTSWDDGSPLDARVADVLGRLGLTGTFYASTGDGGARTIRDEDLARIGRDHELGNHGRTHTPFISLSPRQIEGEIEWGRHELSRFGRVAPVVAPPKGKIDARAARTVRALGLRIRTAPVIGVRTPAADIIEPSFQFFPFRWAELVRNTARRRMIPATPLVLAWARGGQFRDRSVRLVRAALRNLPCVHVWGHAADVERFGMWDGLEEMLAVAAALPVTPVTNGELAGALDTR